MADGTVAVCVSSYKNQEIDHKKTKTTCQCSENLLKKLEKAREEIDSLKEIVKILQQECNSGDAVGRPKMATERDGNVNNVERRTANDVEWRTVINKNKIPASEDKHVEIGFQIPVVINRYAVLDTPSHNASTEIDTQKNRPVKCRPITSSKLRKKPTVLVVGDSHGRSCSEHLKVNLKSEFEVSGIIKPNARSEQVVKVDLKDLNKSDSVVLWAGTNDISRNCTNEGLNEVEKFVSMNTSTNILVMAAPHRHDLPAWSCVNEEVTAFNRKLKKRLKIHNHAMVIDVDLSRECFTRHGLHLNRHGKIEVCNKIAQTIREKSLAAEQTVIPLSYKEDEQQVADLNTPGQQTTVLIHSEGQQDQTTEDDRQPRTRASTRTRRPPSKISTDFL